ncbi:hypothetical protein A359_04050 [secondary endosymbiont of Ctenarytaina eucalypti]|uniref:Uncharacterized protein n=1 Tax=secondary endosymbiont of Ctenarytaina eucalypti TaxID=1199245 RepID=J3YRR9_9ENTR|nr:hypothetical protein A359_04050 [secondary endosymbiont of Ctenarytaina eucalypti]
MLSTGFAQDVEKIITASRCCKKALLFSAALIGNTVKNFSERLLDGPVEIDVTPLHCERMSIKQWYSVGLTTHRIKPR